MHFARYLDFWVRRRGDATALVCDQERLSWNELDRASAAVATHLADIGVRRGDRVGCLLGNSLPWCVQFLAAIRIGAIFVPLNAIFGRFELEQIAADAACRAVLSTPALIAKLGIASDAPADELRIFDLESGRSQAYAAILAGAARFENTVLPDDDILAICYTSGTTGVPKGAALTHRAVDCAMQGLVMNFALRGGEERMLILAPLAFTGGVISNLAPWLVSGGTAWIEKAVDPMRAYHLLRDERITFFGGVPALWERIAQAPDFAEADLSHLRSAYTGGAPVPRPLLELFRSKGVTIRQQYGFTEGCAGVSSPSVEVAARFPASCGDALPGIELRICDSDGRPVAAGEVGEVFARGPQLMAGYWNKPEETRAAFHGEWYKTGDLARIDENGCFTIVDRKKNMLISGGVNVYPAEVERAMAQIPGVLECVVLGLPSERWGQEIAAIVHGPSLADPVAVIEQARALLGSYKAPKHLRLSQQPLPKTASNKIARSQLVELFAQLSA
ncbi:class I adenylate-forming enzyme family protein [Solimonas soli]|uniref:class I adenylate-forming enzyme family protein n=1 Tax=Solimonas soli TaxID=413479 RepID=UPI0004B0EDFD|nr:AMP-binding protein [Solimonas soli]